MIEKVSLALIIKDHGLSSGSADQVLYLRAEEIFLEEMSREGLRMYTA